MLSTWPDEKGGLANQPDRGSVADMDARQLGLLEIAFDAKRILIDQRHHAMTDADVSAGSQIHVGNTAIDGSTNLGSREIELGEIAVCNRLIVSCAGFLRGGPHLFDFLLRDRKLIELVIALVVQFGLFSRRFFPDHHCFGLTQRQAEAFGIDTEKHVAAADVLVVFDQNLGHKPRHVRSNGDDVSRTLPSRVQGASR